MEDWETKCEASVNKDFIYLLTLLLTSQGHGLEFIWY
jgi:hypothetical protein